MRIRQAIDRFLEVFLVVLMSALVLDVVWQVASRYLLSSPSFFTDELAVFLLIWVGLAGAAYAKGKNEHLCIDILSEKLSASPRKWLQVFIQCAIIVFCLSVLVIGGVWLVYTRFKLGQESSALQLPIGYVYLIVPISGLFMIYYSAADLLLLIRSQQT